MRANCDLFCSFSWCSLLSLRAYSRAQLACSSRARGARSRRRSCATRASQPGARFVSVGGGTADLLHGRTTSASSTRSRQRSLWLILRRRRRPRRSTASAPTGGRVTVLRHATAAADDAHLSATSSIDSVWRGHRRPRQRGGGAALKYTFESRARSADPRANTPPLQRRTTRIDAHRPPARLEARRRRRDDRSTRRPVASQQIGGRTGQRFPSGSSSSSARRGLRRSASYRIKTRARSRLIPTLVYSTYLGSSGADIGLRDRRGLDRRGVRRRHV